MERRINRRKQGDLGEASAIEWLTSKGATVFIPFGHSPDFDLVAEIDGSTLRVQVKTSGHELRVPSGDTRFGVSVATRGGNQSWSGFAKKLDPSRLDYLFVHTGEGRRWLIPAAALDGGTAINLGGRKYSEYEIEPGRPIRELVYGELASIHSAPLGGVPKRSNGSHCKCDGTAFTGSNPVSPIASPTPVKPTSYERKLGQAGHAVINQKRRMTIPQKAFFEAGFQNGSKVRVRSLGHGRIVVEQVELPSWAEPASG
jgi:hypothetical protein